MESVGYPAYLWLDRILTAQHPLSDEPDELLFIVIHQVYELLVEVYRADGEGHPLPAGVP